MERDQRVPRRPGSRSPVGRADPGRGHNSMERRSLTGIARERETRTDNTAPRQSHGCKPTHRQPRRITGTWSAGLRPASRGSAKPAPMTPRPANLTAANPRIANRAESRGHGAPVSDRHRAGARNPPQRRRPPPISRLQTHASPTAQNHGDMERRSPTGIARERETRADDTAPCQRECRTASQHRMPRSLTAPLLAAVPLLTAPAKTPATKLRPARPSGGGATEPPLHLEGERQRGVGFCQGRSL